jgi:hypothetical protein
MTDWKPREIDPNAYSDKEVIAELGRELGLRTNVYAKWLEANKLTPDQATAQFGPMFRAHRVMSEIAKAGTTSAQLLKVWARIGEKGGLQRLALAYQVLEICEGNLEVFAAACNSEALAQLAKAFPGSKLVALKPMQEAA